MQTWPIDKIKPYKDQPEGRSRNTTELQNSQAEVGQLYPPIIIPDGDGNATCLAGWRRVTAARALGQKEIEVIVRQDLAGDPLKQAMVFAHSNIHKELTVLEKATLVARWVEDDVINATGALRKVARILGTTETEVRHLVNLDQAPDEVKELVARPGRDGIAWSSFKAELSGLSPDAMVERVVSADGTSRKALARARKKKEVPARMMESTDYVLSVLQQVREGVAVVSTFLRSASPGAKQEIAEAMRPIWELMEEVRGE